MRIRECVCVLILAAGFSNATAADSPEAAEVAATRSKAEGGDASAQNTLGNWLDNGEMGLKQDRAAARQWWTRAADQSSMAATANLGTYYNGGRPPPDEKATPEQAAAWWQHAAEHGLPDAQHTLGTLYTIGSGVPHDDAQAVRLWREAAAKHNAGAEIALSYFHDIGVPEARDYVGSTPWFSRGKELSSDPDDLWQNALILMMGLYGPRNDRMANMYLRLAAEEGVLKAQKELGYAYANGIGEPRDLKLALEWYKKAALGGDLDAQSELGFRYLEGKDVDKNESEAIRWLRLAAKQGHMRAQFALATTLGGAVESDSAGLDESVEWTKRAAMQGFQPAQVMLADIYEKGTPHMPADPMMAYVWYVRSGTAVDRSKEAAHRLAMKLTGAQRKQAEELVLGWEPKRESEFSRNPEYFISLHRGAP
jgi:uncharacterized protein